MKVYALKSCDTCRKALKALTASGISHQVIDVRADGVSAPDLNAMWDALGEALVNRKSTTWRGLDEDARSGNLKALLRAHPTLIKRPVISADGDWTVGWTADVQSRWLGEP